MRRQSPPLKSVSKPLVKGLPRAMAVFLIIASAGCKSIEGPSPNPQYPMGIPNSTILQNLPAIRDLERSSGRHTILVSVYGAATQEGRAKPGNGWIYEFAEDTLPVRPYTWYVLASGEIRYHGPLSDSTPLVLIEIGPGLVTDSDAAVRLAREYGAQAYIDRYPNALVSMRCLRIAQIPTWRVHFATIPQSNPFCEISIELSAQNGQLLYRDVGCLDQ